MPEFVHQASDDQIALAVCFGAVLVSGLIMNFSVHVGRLTGRIRLHETSGHEGPALDGAQALDSLEAEAALRERAA